MKYLRKFNSVEEYESQKDSLAFPNVAFALDKPSTVYYPFEAEDKQYNPMLFTGLGKPVYAKEIGGSSVVWVDANGNIA